MGYGLVSRESQRLHLAKTKTEATCGAKLKVFFSSLPDNSLEYCKNCLRTERYRQPKPKRVR